MRSHENMHGGASGIPSGMDGCVKAGLIIRMSRPDISYGKREFSFTVEEGGRRKAILFAR